MEYLADAEQQLHDVSERANNSLELWKAVNNFSLGMAWSSIISMILVGNDPRVLFATAILCLFSVVSLFMRMRAFRIAEDRMRAWTNFIRNRAEFCNNR